MVIKVKTTKRYRPKNWNELSENKNKDYSYPVSEARLVLIQNGVIQDVPDQILNLKNGTVVLNGTVYVPILISEIEKIEVGDWTYNSLLNTCIKIESATHLELVEVALSTSNDKTIFKILALPEHFSAKHLQSIVDGKLKDDDKVLLECYIHSADYIERGQEQKYRLEQISTDCRVKLNSFNYINFHKSEDIMYPLSALQWAYSAGMEQPKGRYSDWMSFNEWFKLNEDKLCNLK